MEQVIRCLGKQAKYAFFIMTLMCSLATAKETFYSALESKAEVEKEGQIEMLTRL